MARNNTAKTIFSNNKIYGENVKELKEKFFISTFDINFVL